MKREVDVAKIMSYFYPLLQMMMEKARRRTCLPNGSISLRREMHHLRVVYIVQRN